VNQIVKTFENEGFSAEATEEPGCRIHVKVLVKPKMAQKTYQKAVKQVNKQISIPGFRKGHAPERAVISRHSSYIEQEWKEILVNEAYRAALDLTEIYPMGRDSVEKPKIEKYSQEEGAVVKIAYEHYPQIPIIDFSQIKLPSIEKQPIDTDKITEILEEVGRAHADWEDVLDRPVQEGDFVDVTIDSLEEDPPQTLVKDRRFEIADKRLAPWLKKILVGMNIGETSEGVSEVDPEASEDVKKKFKPSKLRVTLLAVKKILLPAIDDTLAKKTGADSLEDLQAKIRLNLEKEVEDERLEKQNQALEKALLEIYHFDLPASFVEAERTERISRKIQRLKDANLSDEEIKAQESAIEKEVAHEIDNALRLYFLNKQLIKQGNISLSNAELNAEIARHMSQNPYLYGRDQDETQTRELVSRVASAMMQRKAKEYALAQIVAKSA
jgi:trigger factor